MADKQISERFEKRKLETYARTLLEAAKTEDRVFTVFIMGAAFAEALALIGFVVALVVK